MIPTRYARSGNVLFMILIAIVLIAALTVAISRSDQGISGMDRERTSVDAAAVVSFALDAKRAVENMTRAGKSESTISFAAQGLADYGTPDTAPANEIFNIAGGGASYRDIPENANDGSHWEFYGFTAAPGVGDAAVPDLMLVMPNVTENFCRAYNKKAGMSDGAAIPTDSGACVNNTGTRFVGSFAIGGAINTMDTASFPAGQISWPAACVQCGSAYHVYYVLLER